MNQGLKILKDTRLRVTESRLEILNSFFEKKTAISQSDIESEISKAIDRVTVYRTLKIFVDKGIVHKILDDNGAVKYALCKNDCHEGVHHHDHLHFKCLMCQETICLEKHLIPAVNMPLGYQVKEINILVQGICPYCKKK